MQLNVEGHSLPHSIVQNFMEPVRSSKFNMVPTSTERAFDMLLCFLFMIYIVCFCLGWSES